MCTYRRVVMAALMVVGVAIGTSASAQRATGSQVQMPKFDEPADLADLPLLGRWKINVAKSTINGSRSNSDTFTWIFISKATRSDTTSTTCTRPTNRAARTR